MPYATQDDLVQRFGLEELTQLTDRLNLGEVGQVTVDAAIAGADARIDSYLGARYSVPVSPTPELLREVACDLARFRLYGNAATDLVRKAFEDAVKILVDLSTGKAVLVGAAPAPAGASPAVGGGTARVVAPCRRVDGATLADFLG